MSEYKRDRRERDWGDRTEDNSGHENREDTYRDGSLKNECWNSGGYTQTGKKAPKTTDIEEKKP